MTVSQLITEAGFKALNMPSPDIAVNGCFAGDLLENVMSRASKGQCFVTAVGGVNVAAIASLIEMPCVILCDGTVPDDLLISSAKARGVNIAVSDMPTFETCLVVGGLLGA